MRLPGYALLILLFSLFPAARSVAAQAPDSVAEIGAGEGFRARIPGGAVVARDSTVYPGGKVLLRVRWTSPLDHPMYHVEFTEYPAGSLGRFPPAQILKESVERLAGISKGTVTESREMRLGSYPGLAFTITGENGENTEVRGRYFVVGERLYTIYVLFAPSVGAPHLQAFLDSFQLAER
ncbi:MAG TPA: hypothetical protein VFQ45_17320 [Longimicrobium sp.]|nr:hypothetical protein [Longimicrobium sp.]